MGKQLKRPVNEAAAVLEVLVTRYGSYSGVALVYSERFGCDVKGAEKVLRRIRMESQPTVNITTLDRLCTLAGLHLSLV